GPDGPDLLLARRRSTRVPADRRRLPRGALRDLRCATPMDRAGGRGGHAGPALRISDTAARAAAVGRARGHRVVEHLIAALGLVFDPYVLAVIFGSAVFGLFVGAIPGLSATMAVALLVPVTFFMPPVPAIAAMVSATAMAIFAGDVPGALLRMPGTPASAAYCDEAYRLTRKGQAELVLGAGVVFSAIGGLFGTL